MYKKKIYIPDNRIKLNQKVLLNFKLFLNSSKSIIDTDILYFIFLTLTSFYEINYS